MVESTFRQISKKTWYRWSFYINIVLFFIIALFLYLVVRDSLIVGMTGSTDAWFTLTRDIAFLSVALALIFFQFFRNLIIIMRRSF